MRDSRKDIEEQPDASVDTQVLSVAMAIDRLAIDVLENQKRLARRCYAGVEETRDVRMREPREQHAFAREALFAAAGKRDVKELHGHAAVEPAVASLGKPNGAHAAVSDRRDQRVRADSLTREPRNG